MADRVTQILQSRAPQPQQDPQLEFANAIAAFQQQNGVSPAQNQSYAQMGTQDRLAQLKQAEASGVPQARALDMAATKLIGNDEVKKDSFKQSVIDHPDDIDPSNSYQIMTAFAQWSKQSGHNQEATTRRALSPQELSMQDMASIASGRGTDYFGKQREDEKALADLAASKALSAHRAAGGSGGSSVFNQVMSAIDSDPQLRNLPTIEKIRLAQSKVGTNLTIDAATGEVKAMEGAATGLGVLAQGTEAGKQRAQLEGEPLTAAANKAAELGTQKIFDAPKAQARINSTLAKSKMVINKIDQAYGKVNDWSAGYGALLSKWPTSQARNLNADIQTIKANLGFDELNEMRQNSPTGGALGQVAVQEIEFLQSVISNLEQSQSVDQLRNNLSEVRQAKIDSDARIQAAYEADFGRFSGGSTTAPAAQRVRTYNPNTGELE